MTVAPRAILHVDMDAFFVSVELLDRPELRGRPVIVGGVGDRGVVAAANYEARAHGVHSAMPSVRARRLCPHAVFLHGDHRRYGAVSRRVMAIFGSFTPLVEPLSLDEAFLDVGGVLRLHGPAPVVAQQIRRRVAEEEGLPCSVGVATTKFLAKLASAEAKPRPSLEGPRPGPGVTVVEPGEELTFLHPLPVERLWGVGPRTLERLRRLGVVTVGDLAALPEATLVATLGRAAGRHLYELAQARDDRAVVPDRVPKSVGHEETFAVDHHRRESLEVEVARMSDAVARRLRDASLAGRTVTLKVRFGDFTTLTRSETLPAAVDSGTAIYRVAAELLARIDVAQGVRLVGVSVGGLGDGGSRQLTLDDLAGPGWHEADRAVDEIRARFGDDAIAPARLAGGDGLRVKRQGDQTWGPDS